MSFETEFEVRFGDIDHARVVYFPRFFHYFHQAFEAWFGEALGVPYPHVVGEMNIGFPSVHVETDFRRPIRYGDRMRVRVDLVRIGRRSITNRYTLTSVNTGEVAATATVTTVAVVNDSFASTPIPEQLREKFEAYMNR